MHSTLLHHLSPKTREKVLSEVPKSHQKSTHESNDNSEELNSEVNEWENQMCVDDLPLDLSSNDCSKEADKCLPKESITETNDKVFNECLISKINNGLNGDQMVNNCVHNLMNWISFPIDLCLNYIRFGTYITCGHSFQLYSHCLKLTSIKSFKSSIVRIQAFLSFALNQTKHRLKHYKSVWIWDTTHTMVSSLILSRRVFLFKINSND